MDEFEGVRASDASGPLAMTRACIAATWLGVTTCAVGGIASITLCQSL